MSRDVIVVAKAGCSICCTSDYWVKTSTPPTQECGPWPGEGGATAAFAATAAAEAPAATEGEVLTGEHFDELGLTLGLIKVCTSSYMPESHNNIIFNMN